MLLDFIVLWSSISSIDYPSTCFFSATGINKPF
jgi:hypothetical protein